MIKHITTFFSDKILLLLVFFFPLIILFRSAAINITVTAASIIMLFYILKKNSIKFSKNKLLTYILILFSFIFISSIINFTNFDLLLKSLGNFRFLLFSMADFLEINTISNQLKKSFIYFNILQNI